MTLTARIHRKLTEALAPIRLEIINDSERHAGHHGHRRSDPGAPPESEPGTITRRGTDHPQTQAESHFSVMIVSAAFEGQPLRERHRMVYRLLSDELVERIHAIGLQTRTPGEDEPRRLQATGLQ